MYKIELRSTTSLNEVLQIITNEPNTKPIAGGTDILPLLQKELHIEQLKSQPINIDNKIKLVDLSNINELQGIVKNHNQIEIGACTTHAELAANAIIEQYFPSLRKATAQIGTPQIRNRGTIGGNIANASPAADTIAPLVVLKAELLLSSLNEQRKILLENFFIAPGKTVLRSNEIITKIILPMPQQNNIQFYRRIAARKAHACAKASVAFYGIKENDILADVHIALGAVGPTVISACETAKILEGNILTPLLIEKAVDQVVYETNPIDDIRSTKEYRRAMIAELLRQELEKLLNIQKYRKVQL